MQIRLANRLNTFILLLLFSFFNCTLTVLVWKSLDTFSSFVLQVKWITNSSTTFPITSWKKWHRNKFKSYQQSEGLLSKCHQKEITRHPFSNLIKMFAKNLAPFYEVNKFVSRDPWTENFSLFLEIDEQSNPIKEYMARGLLSRILD